MFCPENHLPCNDCEEIRFHAMTGNRSAGYIECEDTRIAVWFTMRPQPHLRFHPPLRLLESDDAGLSFLAACLDEGDERWFDFEFHRAGGQVSWRRDLVTGEPEEIDAALREARSFFNECWPWLEDTVARCGAVRRRPSILQRIFKALSEV